MEESRLELFRYVSESLDKEETFHILGFEFLHRYNIVRLQNKLIAAREQIYKDPSFDCIDLQDLLHDYNEAIQNYNNIRDMRRLDHTETDDRKQRLKVAFMTMTNQYRWTNPFESHYYFLKDNKVHVDTLRSMLRQYLPRRLTYSSAERIHRGREFEEGQPPHDISAFVDRLARLLVALVGGCFLIVPMLIMANNPTQTKSLITASVSTLLFSCAISLGLKTSNNETLVSTATYAAVLVVFVGITTQPPATS